MNRVQMIVDLPAGLAPDVAARLIAPPLSERLGQSVVVDTAADALAADFAGKSPAIVRLGRAAFMRQNDYRNGIADAVEHFCRSVTTDAAQEGSRAFLEKRAPNW